MSPGPRTSRDALERAGEHELLHLRVLVDNALCAALDRIDGLLVEVRGLTGHFAQNRIEIVSKINRAHALATSALGSRKAAGLPVKGAA